MKQVYLDNAATTPLDKEVIEAMTEVMEKHFGNPSSIHAAGRESRTIIENARKHIAELLNVAPGEIFFTSGGTEADNMIINCAVDYLKVTDIITSKIEHHAVLHTVEKLSRAGKINLHFVDLDELGHISMPSLESLLKTHSTDKNLLVSLMHANNEIGNMIDLEKTGALCNEHKAYFHSDTVQTIGHVPIDIKATGLHFLNASAHKFNGPKGVGFAYIDSSIKVKPFICGGSQERNMRGGTENIYGIKGIEKALEIAYREMEMQEKHIRELKEYMCGRLSKEVPGVEFNGDVYEDSLFTIINASFPDTDMADMLLFNLDIEGISVSGGSACSSGSDVGSHVMAEIRKDKANAPSIRFSFGKYNTKEEVDYTLEKLKEVLNLKEKESKA